MTLTPDNIANDNNLVPFRDHVKALRCVLVGCPQASSSFRFLFVDLLGNVAVFVPLGVGLVGLLNRPTRSRRVTLMLVVVGGVLLSLFIESIQINIPTRAADLTDVLLNSLGTAVGAALVLLKRDA
jgi:glycopeptide antibiotics resistance protein